MCLRQQWAAAAGQPIVGSCRHTGCAERGMPWGRRFFGVAFSVKSVCDLGDDEDPHIECSQLLLQYAPSPPARGARCCPTAWFTSIHFIATRLLQLTVVSSTRVNYSASAACDECSDLRHSELCDHVKPALKQQTGTCFVYTDAHCTCMSILYAYIFIVYSAFDKVLLKNSTTTTTATQGSICPKSSGGVLRLPFPPFSPPFHSLLLPSSLPFPFPFPSLPPISLPSLRSRPP